MAPETSTLNNAMQVKLVEEPTATVGVEREREADVIKPLGTEGKASAVINIWRSLSYTHVHDIHTLLTAVRL